MILNKMRKKVPHKKELPVEKHLFRANKASIEKSFWKVTNLSFGPESEDNPIYKTKIKSKFRLI